MKLSIAVVLGTLAASAATAPLTISSKEHTQINPEDIIIRRPATFGFKESVTTIDKRIAPVAAGIFGVAAGSVANAIVTGATKGATSGSVRGTINKIFGGSKRSAPAEEDQWTFDDLREVFAKTAAQDLFDDEAKPEEAAVCVGVAYEVGGDDSLVREAQSVKLEAKADNETASFDCFLLAAPLNFTVPIDQINSATVAVIPGPGTWENGVLSF